MTSRLIAALFTFLCSRDAIAWDGWHPTAWDSMGSVGVVERTNLYAVPASFTLLDWTSPTTSVSRSYSFLFDVTAVPETNAVLTGRWSFVLNRYDGDGNLSPIVETVEQAGRRVATNLVLRDAEILAFDCYRALCERYEALGLPASATHTNWLAPEKPRFARHQREALVGYKQWLSRHASRFLDPSTAVDGSFSTWFETHSTNWHFSSRWSQRPYDYTSPPPPYLTLSRLCELAAAPVSTSIVPQTVNVEGWRLGVLDQQTVAVDGAVTSTIPWFLAFTPARQLSCAGPPVPSVQTVQVQTVGMDFVFPLDPLCDWSFPTAATNGQIVTNAWLDSFGVCHVWTGAVGSFATLLVTNTTMMPGSDIRDYGWCKMRDAINALRYTWDSAVWTSTVVHTWHVSGSNAVASRIQSLPCSTYGLDSLETNGTLHAQELIPVVTGTVAAAPVFAADGPQDGFPEVRNLMSALDVWAGDDPWTSFGIHSTGLSYAVSSVDNFNPPRRSTSFASWPGTGRTNLTASVSLYVRWSAESFETITNRWLYSTADGSTVAGYSGPDCHILTRDAIVTRTNLVVVDPFALQWGDAQRPWLTPVGSSSGSRDVTLGMGSGATCGVYWCDSTFSDDFAVAPFLVTHSNAYSITSHWIPDGNCAQSCIGPFTLTHDFVDVVSWSRPVNVRAAEIGVVILWDKPGGFAYK